MAYGNHQLPYDVTSSEYLNIQGSKISKSSGAIIKVKDVIDKFDVDVWRYVMIAISPETGDSDFKWDLFVDKVNNELIAIWGNLVNRSLKFSFKHFNKIPKPGTLIDIDKAMLLSIEDGFSQVSLLYKKVKLRAALEKILNLSKEVNKYLSDTTPWSLVKTDKKRASTIMYVTLQAIDWLKLMWFPILPHTCEKLHIYLGYNDLLGGRVYSEKVKDSRGEHNVLRYDHSMATGTWRLERLRVEQALIEPKSLFNRIDDLAVNLGHDTVQA